MRLRGWALVALVWLSPALYAQEAVGKVVEIKLVDQGTAGNLSYQRQDKGPWSAFVDMDSLVHDRYSTDAQTVAAIEFTIGGRVGLNRGSEVELISEQGARSLKRLVLKKGGLFVKCNKLKQPLEIQTNGGVMGIKGTEFVVEQSDTGDTKVSLLEGQIELLREGLPPASMAPGDAWSWLPGGELSQRHFNPDELREHLLHSPEWGNVFQSLQTLRQVLQAVAPISGVAPGVADQAQQDIQQARSEILRALDMIGSYRGVMQAAFQGERNAVADSVLKNAGVNLDLDALRNLQPPSGPPGPPPGRPSPPKAPTRLQVTSSPPTFSWEAVPGASSYLLLVSSHPGFASLDWSQKVTGTSVSYPDSAQPLRPGRHFWRLIPLDEHDELLKGWHGAAGTFSL